MINLVKETVKKHIFSSILFAFEFQITTNVLPFTRDTAIKHSFPECFVERLFPSASSYDRERAN